MKENSYQIIAIDTWKRKVHYQVFKDILCPYYCISFKLDITDFYKYLKQHGYSFTLSMVYAVTKSASEIEEFRYRFKDGNVVLYNKIDTSLTYIDDWENELFKVVNIPMQESLECYVKTAKEVIENQTDYFTGPLNNDIYQFSPMPWIPFSHVSHTDRGNTKNAIPMFDWGKFETVGDKKFLPFSVQVHHSFVDGIHVAKFIDHLTKYMETGGKDCYN